MDEWPGGTPSRTRGGGFRLGWSLGPSELRSQRLRCLRVLLCDLWPRMSPVGCSCPLVRCWCLHPPRPLLSPPLARMGAVHPAFGLILAATQRGHLAPHATSPLQVRIGWTVLLKRVGKPCAKLCGSRILLSPQLTQLSSFAACPLCSPVLPSISSSVGRPSHRRGSRYAGPSRSRDCQPSSFLSGRVAARWDSSHAPRPRESAAAHAGSFRPSRSRSRARSQTSCLLDRVWPGPAPSSIRSFPAGRFDSTSPPSRGHRAHIEREHGTAASLGPGSIFFDGGLGSSRSDFCGSWRSSYGIPATWGHPRDTRTHGDVNVAVDAAPAVWPCCAGQSCGRRESPARRDCGRDRPTRSGQCLYSNFSFWSRDAPPPSTPGRAGDSTHSQVYSLERRSRRSCGQIADESTRRSEAGKEGCAAKAEEDFEEGSCEGRKRSCQARALRGQGRRSGAASTAPLCWVFRPAHWARCSTRNGGPAHVYC